MEDKPFLRRYVDLVSRWDRRLAEIAIDAGVHHLVRRGWYESTDFWSPALFERFLLPSLRDEVKLAHEAGAKFGYIMTTGALPLLDLILDAGVDVLIGVAPLQDKGGDLAEMKRRTAGRMALWGGVNGFLTVELGDEEEVRQAVREAMDVLAPDGGFVLSPVDNVTADTPTAWRNVDVLIDEWQRLR